MGLYGPRVIMISGNWVWGIIQIDTTPTGHPTDGAPLTNVAQVIMGDNHISSKRWDCMGHGL